MGSNPIQVASLFLGYAFVAQLVEQRTENPRVVGSIPTGGTIYADLAHLVERHLAKVEVASSSLVTRSIWRHSQVVRQRSAKPLFPSSSLGVASKRPVPIWNRSFFYVFLFWQIFCRNKTGTTGKVDENGNSTGYYRLWEKAQNQNKFLQIEIIRTL